MGVDRTDNGTDDSAEEVEKPPAKDTQWRPPPDRPGSPGQPSRLESSAAAIRDQKAAAAQGDEREGEQSPAPGEESGGEAGQQGSADGDRRGSTTETEESPQDSEPRDDRAPAQVRFESSGRPKDDDPPSTRIETPGSETDDVDPGEQPDPVRSEPENETVPEDDLKAPAEVPSGESAEQEDEQKPVPPDHPATGTQLGTEDQPEAWLVADRDEKPKDQATTELDGRQTSDEEPAARQASREGMRPGGEAEPATSGLDGVLETAPQLSVPEQTSDEGQKKATGTGTGQSDVENVGSGDTASADTKANEQDDSGTGITDSDPKITDLDDEWRKNANAMKTNWADLESEQAPDKPPEGDDQADSLQGEDTSEGTEDFPGDGERPQIAANVQQLDDGSAAGAETGEVDDKGSTDEYTKESESLTKDHEPIAGNGEAVADIVGTSARLERLDDEEYAEHVQYLRDRLAEARGSGEATDERYVVDAEHMVWAGDRHAAHRAILQDLYDRNTEVPCERKAVIAGGLGGAGKSTVLENYAEIDRSQYMTINPDDIKEEMARRGMLPKIEGLSPMEASDLAHEESSYLAKQVAQFAYEDGKT